MLSGGGTGGHIYPAIAIAEAIEKQIPNAEFLFVGAQDRMEMQVVPKNGYRIEGLWISGFQRKNIWKNTLLPFKIISSLYKCYFILKKFNPDIVIGTGGYASAALLKTAQFLKIPTLIQEQNSYAGITNKLLAPKAKAICVAYEQMEQFFPKEKIIFTGNPIRKQILDHLQKHTQNPAQTTTPENKELNLLVLGGSLGAKAINEALATYCKNTYFNTSKLSIVWQCGKLYYEEYKNYSNAKVKVVSYIEDMGKAFKNADIILSRAGAGTLSELAIVGKPVVFVPSPYVSEDHQTKNAEYFTLRKAALILPEQKLKEDLVTTLNLLIDNKELRESLSLEIKKMAKPYATEKIVDEIKKLLIKK